MTNVTLVILGCRKSVLFHVARDQFVPVVPIVERSVYIDPAPLFITSIGVIVMHQQPRYITHVNICGLLPVNIPSPVQPAYTVKIVGHELGWMSARPHPVILSLAVDGDNCDMKHFFAVRAIAY